MYKFYNKIDCSTDSYAENSQSIKNYLTGIIHHPDFKKWLMRINITCFLLIATFLQVSLASNAQNISLSRKGITLSQVFKEIKKQSGYDFVYKYDLLKKGTSIDIDVKDQPLRTVLEECFENQPFTFSIENKTVVVVPVKHYKTFQSTQLQSFDVTGTVTDTNRVTLPGVNVRLKSKPSLGTSTDVNGKFALNVPENETLVFSYIGFREKEVKVTGRILNVVLSEANSQLEEVVVIGYGTQSQRFSTSSIGTVKFANIDKGADYNAVKALQGRVPGVNISSASGKPGSAPNILVRGIGSLGSSSPLYVVDGIPSESMPVLNNDDIEQIDILKDASSAAIYGSRANNGVVIITTKSGKNGQTKVDFSSHYGIGTIAHDIKMANVAEYTQVSQAALDNYNAQMGTIEQLYIPPVIEETNWMDVIYRKPAIQSSQSVSLSGGNDKTIFYTSFGHNKQEGALIKSDYDQYNLRTKFSHRVNNIFKLNMNIAGSYAKYGLVEDSDSSLKIIRTAREEQPWYSPFNEDGSYKANGVQILRHNPLMLLNEEDWIIGKKQGQLNTSLDITPIKGLKYTPSISLYGILDEETKKISEKHDARKFNADWAALQQQKDVSYRYVIDNIVTYDNSWNKLKYTAMVGHSFEKYQYERFGAKSDNYSDGKFPSSSFDLINAGPNIYPNAISYTARAIESYLGRIILNYDNKYIFNSSIRRDGSSKFSRDRLYGNFPSASFAWLMTEESFIPKNNLLNYLKLRVSWGATGNLAGIGDFAPLSLVSSGGSSYNGSAGFKISQDEQSLSWEKANQVNIGFDSELYHNRINLSVDAFYQKTTGLLYNRPIHSTSGYSTIPANIGSLENKGVEIVLDGKILTGPFKWNMGANISFIQNKLLSLVGGSDMIVLGSGGANFGAEKHALINGKSIGAYYMLKADGIYQKDSDVPIKLYNKGVRAGDLIYQDISLDGDITEDDRQYAGKATPDYFGGITSTMKWKNFELGIFAQFSVGGNIMSVWRGGGGVEGTDHLGTGFSNIKAYNKFGSLVDTEQFYNVSKEVANGYWKGEGTSNTIPRPVKRGVHTGYTAGYNNQVSTRYLEDASYFKLKTITLAYQLPQNITQKLGIRGAKIYTSLDNFFVFTDYAGYDPEFSVTSTPSATNFGVDYGELPTLKNWIIGMNINF